MTHNPGIGRLIVVLDESMNSQSITAFGKLARSWPSNPPLTVIAGTRARVVKGFGQRWETLFYNPNEFVPLPRLMGMLPWSEIWIIKDGLVWALRDGRMIATGTSPHHTAPTPQPVVRSLSAARALRTIEDYAMGSR
ncbi:MAG: hypothetical protein H6922_02505 [Pseudomonadaceae bacterium]|nr:hypothetical protein [Pseudomonadaceae bacterium]